MQAREGVMGLKSGCDAVLGQASRPITRPSEVPIEMAVGRQKMRPGSGYLSVKVVPDGPTRVLQIMDIRNTVSRDKLIPTTGEMKSCLMRCSFGGSVESLPCSLGVQGYQ